MNYFEPYFTVLKNIFRLNFTQYFIVGIPNKQQHEQITFNHSSNIGYEDSMNLNKKYTAKGFSFLAIDSTQIILCFRKNILERI